jgi:hypothetical protein
MKISTKMNKGILVFIAVLLLAPLPAFAQDDLMLMMAPALSGGNRPLKNFITVAKANGKFTDPVAAVNSITDASSTNPYLVVIAPGIYTVTSTLVMKDYVDITGSGENVTKIKGTISGADWSTAIIKGANNSALSSLTVENTGGGGAYSIALSNDNTSPRVSNITAKASGGNSSRAIENDSGAAPVMTNVTAEASGNQNSYAVFNWGASGVMMNNVTAKASGGTFISCGVYNSGSTAVMNNVTASATGGTQKNYGVYNFGLGVVMTNVTATASGGTYSCGIYNQLASPMIRRSTMKGNDEGLKTEGGTATLSQSTIIWGAPVDNGGIHKCVACDNGEGLALDKDCHPIP